MFTWALKKEQWIKKEWFLTDKYLLVISNKSRTFKCYMVILSERPVNIHLARKKGTLFGVTLLFPFPIYSCSCSEFLMQVIDVVEV